MSHVSGAARAMGSPPAADRIYEPDGPRSPVVLLLVDFVNLLDFP